MEAKEVLLLLTDDWADWEASFAVSFINAEEGCVVKTIAVDEKPKASMGGLRTEIDYTISRYTNFDNLAMVILTGGTSWRKNDYQDYPEIREFVANVRDKGVPVAAICGATSYLEKHGFIDHSQPKQVTNENGFITANGTAALEFTREILLTLKVRSDEDVEGWYNYFKNGE